MGLLTAPIRVAITGWFITAEHIPVGDAVKVGCFTSQVIMHDLATKNKQKAMEYIIENQEDENRRKGDSGEGPEGGKNLDESQ